MNINFRQGLIGFQQDTGNPVYLQPSVTPGFVSHVVSPTPTIAAFAHAGSDYLVKFETTVANAWQITAPVTTYLYWDIDQLTAQVTRGITIPIPINSLTTPALPVDDQHWFDLNVNLMKVWSTARNKWVEKIRLFAGHVIGGNTNAIVMFPAGSQINLNTPSNPGYILLDSMLQPLKKSSLNGEFLTDDDQARVLTTVGTAGVLVQPVNRVIPVRAGEAIPKMSMVYFSAADTVRLASSDPGLIPSRPPIGILVDALASGEVGTLVTGGEVTYDQWDWSASPGAALYSDSFGQLSLVRPAGLMAFRVGFVKNARTVLVHVDSETNPQVYEVSANDFVITGQTPVTTTDVINGIGERVITIIVPDVTTVQRGLMTAAQHIALDSYGIRISDVEAGIVLLESSKANVIHSHAISDVTGLQTALNGKSDVGHNHDLAYAPIVHNHDLVYAPIMHGHNIGDVSGLQTALNQKANRSHLNAFNEIFGSVDRTGLFDVGTAPTLEEVLDSKVALAGDTMTGALVLSGAPTIDLHAATKKYVDDNVFTPGSIDAFTDVDTTTVAPVVDEVLKWNGSNWIPGVGGGGGFVFQVGAAIGTDHYHYALLTMAQAQFLIQNTFPVYPVADVANQPYFAIISDVNNSGYGPHSHVITVWFDYVNHSFIGTNVTSNHPVPHVAYLVGDGSGGAAGLPSSNFNPGA
jgi:hypothetical protein